MRIARVWSKLRFMKLIAVNHVTSVISESFHTDSWKRFVPCFASVLSSQRPSNPSDGGERATALDAKRSGLFHHLYNVCSLDDEMTCLSFVLPSTKTSLESRKGGHSRTVAHRLQNRTASCCSMDPKLRLQRIWIFGFKCAGFLVFCDVLCRKKTKLSTLLINHNSRYSSLSCLHWWLKSVNLVHVTYPGSSQTLRTLFFDMKMPCDKFIMDIRGLDHEQHFLCFASRRATGMVSRNIFQHVISN